MKVFLISLLGFAVVAALPTNEPASAGQRIVGGTLTTIQQYPFAAALLVNQNGIFTQYCGGTIISSRTVLTAAHCFNYIIYQPSLWRTRVGSSYANSGGYVYDTAQLIYHPSYNRASLDMDFALVRIAGNFAFNNFVRSVGIASATYNLPDNNAVWAVGWGATCYNCPSSEQLRHVQIWTINLYDCRSRYNEVRRNVTNNMVCSGWLDVGNRDACTGDAGGPIIHNGVVVGVTSWGEQCGLPRYPGVSARVSSATNWIINNA